MPEIIYKKPHSLSDKPFHYCPGCSHGLVHRLVTEVIDELGIADNTIAVAPVGCAVTADEYFRVDTVQAAHGRAPAVATGIKRALPDRVVFTYQGDGDLAAIGTAETVHSAARGENITIIFINNTIYGMTGRWRQPLCRVRSRRPRPTDATRTRRAIRCIFAKCSRRSTARLISRAQPLTACRI